MTPCVDLWSAPKHSYARLCGCPPPAANCAVLSSPGAFGFTPWVDRDGGYYAIIAMEVSEADSGIAAFSVQLAQDLKPLIRDAL